MQKSPKQILNSPALTEQVNQLDSEGWILPTSQKRAEETRDRLIEAAEAVFAEKGYVGARINDIADQAGVSAASVYVRFKDKDGLFNAVLDKFREQIGALQDYFFNGPGLDGIDTQTAIQAIILDNTAKFTHNAGIMRATLQRGLSEPEVMERFLRFRTTLIDHIVTFVAKRNPKADPKAVNARVADAFDTIYGALFMRITLRNDPPDPEQFAEFLGELLVPHILGTKQG